LANDVIEVAYPILVKSMVLDDADLIELILSKAESHQQAITKRQEVSLSATETLVGTGNEEVIQSLLKNEAAEIMPATMMRLVDQSLETESFREVLLRRRYMKPELARRMYTWVGNALREYINDSFDLSQDDVDEAISLAISEAMDTDPFDDGDNINLKDYANAPLYEPTSSTPIQSLADGDIYRFGEIFIDLSGLSAASVTRLLYDSGSEALAIAFKAVGVERPAFSEIYCYLRGNRPYEAFIQPPSHEKAMAHFDRMDSNSADRVFDTWRRAPDYGFEAH
jgi:uncharacterized protein (DUF2336 family)